MKTRHCTTAAVSALAALLVGCSGKAEGWNYAIPKKICGVNMQESVVKPLLPPGDTLDEQIRAAIGEDQDVSERCLLKVDKGKSGDGKYLWINLDRETQKVDAVAEAHRLRYGNSESVHLAGSVTSAAVGDTGALVAMRCKPKTAKSAPYAYLMAEVRMGDYADKPKDPEARHDHLQAFLRDYIPATEAARCKQ
ncbi:hypothetical protein [Streptomyces sp. Da 82-17]|uniref:hypothetical protein n=1 Tax=Streptomyces sp. Da 82-17 TaxID=3377116 RepID=UPI0038D38399